VWVGRLLLLLAAGGAPNARVRNGGAVLASCCLVGEPWGVRQTGLGRSLVILVGGGREREGQGELCAAVVVFVFLSSGLFVDLVSRFFLDGNAS